MTTSEKTNGENSKFDAKKQRQTFLNLPQLTPRQNLLMALYVLDQDHANISRELHISELAVPVIISKIRRKLGIEKHLGKTGITQKVVELARTTEAR